MLSKRLKQFIRSASLTLLLAGSYIPALAQTRYTTGGGEPIGFDGTFGDYISAMYSFGVSIVGATAFFALIFAGLEYMTSGGNASRQSDARERIRYAIYGIILLLSAVALFNTINPQILSGS